MSTGLKIETGSAQLYLENKKVKSKNRKHGIKSKEIIYKIKCQKELRYKLKKYKLRRDGIEDPDILDITKLFNLSLKIKSPIKEVNFSIIEDYTHVETKVADYLLNMISNKKSRHKVLETDNENMANVNNDHEIISNEYDQNNKQAVDDTHNAFELMMNSRHKVIGSNSPGKEINVSNEVLEDEEKALKNTTKLKRTEVLQRMAERKGSIQNKLKEEIKDRKIKEKMDKRAERLKKMLTSGNSKTIKKSSVNKVFKCQSSNTLLEKKSNIEYKNNSEIQLQSVDHLSSNITKENKTLTRDMLHSELTFNLKKQINNYEDDFLKNLSPSLKNRNMLSYFKKVEKDSADIQSNEVINEDNSVDQISKGSANKQTKQKYKKQKSSLSQNQPKDYIENRKNNNSSKHNKIKKIKKNIFCKNNYNHKDESAKSLQYSNSVNIEKPLSPVYSLGEENEERSHRNIKPSLPKMSCEEKKIKTENNKTFEHAANSNETKRKRKRKTAPKISSPTRDRTVIVESRPKRNVSKPVKYYDEFVIFSSDEELQIFTPKTKRSKFVISQKNIVEEENMVSNKSSNRKILIKAESNKTALVKTDIIINAKHLKNIKLLEGENSTSNVKLAPIFKSKTPLDKVSLEAKQKFLHSGVPDQIKKMSLNHTKRSNQENWFNITTHIQQNSSTQLASDAKVDYYGLAFDADNTIDYMTNYSNYCKILCTPINNVKRDYISRFLNNVSLCLEKMKQSYPNFPVYRSYRILKSKYNWCKDKNSILNIDLDNSSEFINTSIESMCDEPLHLPWVEKYRLTSAKNIIGNFESIKEIKKWLSSWHENEILKINSKEDSDYSDFCHSSDTDSRDSMKAINNLLIVTGSVGSGKTSSIYAVASDLSMKVIEVNVSSKRTGKIILQDLQEATQSHKVNRTTSSENSQEFNFKGSKPKKLNSKKLKKLISKAKRHKSLSNTSNQTSSIQDVSRTEISLILIDDADIIFDQDDGFISSLTQIIQCSKRPVILVMSSLTCPHLQKFLQSGNIVKMRSISSQMLGTWLDIMCLAETGLCWPGIGKECLDFYKSDIRKSINYLHFLVSSEVNLQSNNDIKSEDNYTFDVEEESSNTSWAGEVEKNLKNSNNKLLLGTPFFKNKNLKLSYSMQISKLWWNIPRLLFKPLVAKNNEATSVIDHKAQTKQLSMISNMLNSFSISNLICGSNNKYNITLNPWQIPESDSVSESENFDYYDNCISTGYDLSHRIVKDSLFHAYPSFDEQDIDLKQPSSEATRSKSQIMLRHNILTKSLNAGVILDRRALAMDYWSTCRNICRVERDKIDNNTKRNNRYCHYLKSMKVMLKNDTFDKFCESLSTEESCVNDS